MKNMAFKALGNIIISVHNENPMTDEESNASLNFLKGCDISQTRMLVVTKGGSPTAAQRKRLNDVLQGQEMTTAVVADGMILMGVVTAMSWFNKKIKAFSIGDIEDAFRYLEVPETQFSLFMREVNRLRHEVSKP